MTQLQQKNLSHVFAVAKIPLDMKIALFLEAWPAGFQTAVMVNCQVFTFKAIQLQVNIDICSGMSNAGGPMNLTESLGTPTPKGS